MIDFAARRRARAAGMRATVGAAFADGSGADDAPTDLLPVEPRIVAPRLRATPPPVTLTAMLTARRSVDEL